MSENEVKATEIVNLTGATLHVGELTFNPELSQPVPNRFGGFSQYPMKYWDCCLKQQKDGKFQAVKNNRGWNLLDNEKFPQVKGRIYIVTPDEGRLFENAKRRDFLVFKGQEEIDWRATDKEKTQHEFTGSLVSIRFIRTEIEQNLCLVDEEELPVKEDSSENLGNGVMAEALDKALAEAPVEEEEAKEETPKAKKTKKSSKKAEAKED